MSSPFRPISLSMLALTSLLCGSLTAFAGSAGEIQSKIDNVGALQVSVDTNQGVVYVKKAVNNPEGRVNIVDIRSGESKGETGDSGISSEAVKFDVTPVNEDGVVKFVSSDAEPMIETTAPTEKLKSSPGSAIGLTAGLITGLGFAYRQFFDNGWGLNVGLAGWVDNPSKSSFANIGAEVMRVLDEGENARFYVLAGTSFYYWGEQVYDPGNPPAYDPNDPKPTDPPQGTYSHQDTMRYNIGAGIGLEWSPGLAAKKKNIALAIELPISLMLKQTRGQGVVIDGIRPIPSAAIIYYFKR